MSETGTRPSTLPEWATGGSADVSEPLTAKKQLGWVDDEIPPPEWFNWWMELVYDWIYYLSQGYIRVFDRLETAFDTLAEGEVGLVNEDDASSGTAFLEVLWYGAPTVGLDGDNTTAIEADGKYVYMGTYNRFAVFDRSGTKLNEWTYSAAHTVTGISSDGTNVFVATTENYIEAYTCVAAATGSGKPATTGVWAGGVYDHGADLYCVYSDGNAVFAGGAADGSGHEVVKLTYASGAKAAGFNWDAAGGEVYAVRPYNEERVYVCGDYSTALSTNAASLEYDLSAVSAGGSAIWVDNDKQATLYAIAVDQDHVYFGGEAFDLSTTNPQVAVAIPLAVNSVLYYCGVKVKGITYLVSYTSDSSATVQEIVEGLEPLLNAQLAASNVIVTEDDTKLTFTSESDYNFEVIIGGDSGSPQWNAAAITGSTRPGVDTALSRVSNVWAFPHRLESLPNYWEPLWSNKGSLNHTQTVRGLVSDGQYLYVAAEEVGSDDYQIVVLDAKTGNEVTVQTLASAAKDSGDHDAFCIATDQFQLYVGHSQTATSKYFTTYCIKTAPQLVRKMATNDATRRPLHNGILICERR
jgi:hypothetical protein